MNNVLIIDKEFSATDITKRYLELSGFQVFIAGSEREGLAWLREYRANVIILDPVLEQTQDASLCKRIRMKTDVPIVLISNLGEEVFKLMGFRMGADDYLVKPFSPNELVARVNAHFERYCHLTGNLARKDGTIKVRDLEIDRSERRVYKNKKEVLLTFTEYKILRYLAEHINRVVSRKELFEMTWGGKRNDVMLNVYISRLRDKIEVYPKSPKYIETIWGEGYCMRKE